MNHNKKGFTLIELLVVIGILAVLATITVLVLNPAQLFAQARDSQRLSDMGTLKGAISLYLTGASGPDMGVPADFTCGTNFGASLAGVPGTASPFLTSTTPHPATSGVFEINGTGWVTVNLGATSGGSPIPVLPRDPSQNNNSDFFYAYACDNGESTFELNAFMESSRYSNGGDNDVESTDGGGNANAYEVGTDPGLDL